MKEYPVTLKLVRAYPSYLEAGYRYDPSISIPKEVIDKLGWKKTTRLKLFLDEENRRVLIKEALSGESNSSSRQSEG